MITRIDPHPSVINLLKMVSQYKELGFFLCWRDILVRYKQTVIGIVWVIFQPLVMMLIFTFIFGRLISIDTNGLPYPMVVLSGILAWQFFSMGLNESSQCLIANSNLIKKVYFPKILLVASSTLVSALDFLVVLLLLVPFLIWYQIPITFHLLFLVLSFFIISMSIIGFGSFFAALNCRYRDFRYIVPFALQIGMYVSPVIYLSSTIKSPLKILLFLNPIAGAIEACRYAIFGDLYDIYWNGLFLSISVAMMSFIFGIIYFLRFEKTFADEL